MPSLLTVTDLFPWVTLGIALLIGVIVGAERETARAHAALGLRDIVLTSAMGWITGRLDEPLIGIAVMLGIVALMIVHRPRTESHIGVTTEFAVISVFLMSYALGLTREASLVVLIVALSIALALLLDAKSTVKRVFKEVITEKEVADAIRFLAIIFIILPLLPDGRFGPYEFFSPRTLWVAVILVTGVSFVGYFLEKFLGLKLGTWLVAVLGGMVSTTVMTQTFAKQAAANPDRLRIAWQAATLSNSIQFPRLLILLLVTAPGLAQMTVVALLPAFAAGLIMSAIIGHGPVTVGDAKPPLQNPLRLWPALQFAVYMAGVSIVGAVLYDVLGDGGLYLTSAIGAILDVDAIALNAADRVGAGIMDLQAGQIVLVIAVGSNMIVKSILAATSGSFQFFIRMLFSFAVMFAAAALGLLL